MVKIDSIKFNFSSVDKTVYTYCAPLGFALEAQAKFTPDKKISPIVGYRLTTNFENNFSTFSDGTNKSFPVDSLKVVTNTIFAGISFNW